MRCVAQCEAFVQWIERLTEFFKIGQCGAQCQIGMTAIQQNTQYGLCGTRIVDDLMHTYTNVRFKKSFFSDIFRANLPVWQRKSLPDDCPAPQNRPAHRLARI